MKKRLNLTKILLPYTKKKFWVALSPKGDKVVGAGKDKEIELKPI